MCQATVAGTGAYGKLFYLCNMLFRGKLALFGRNFGFNLHLKILNTHNCIQPGTLSMVNLHIVPIVPKMWGHLTISTLCHMTMAHPRAKITQGWGLGIEDFGDHDEPPNSLTPFHLMPTEFPFEACLLPRLLQTHPRTVWFNYLGPSCL